MSAPQRLRNRTARETRAFSLIELVLVMFIIGICTTLAAPRVGGTLARHRAYAAANRVAVDMALARQTARATSASVTIRFDHVSGDYTLDPVPDPNAPDRNYVVHLSQEPYNISELTADFGGNSQLTFNGWGTPNSGGTVRMSAGTSLRFVSVDPATGETTIHNSDPGPVSSPTPTPMPTASPDPCKAKDEYCTYDSECCSHYCQAASGKCKDE